MLFFIFLDIYIFSYAANYKIEGEASFRVTIWLIVSPEAPETGGCNCVVDIMLCSRWQPISNTHG
jgi:hypothetical protein